MKEILKSARQRIWESYINIICKLIRSEKAFVFNVATVLLFLGKIGGEIWLAVALGLMGANMYEKSKLVNGNYKAPPDYEA